MQPMPTSPAQLPGTRARRRPAYRRDAWTPVVQYVLQPLLRVRRRDRTQRYVPTVERLLSLPSDVARRRTLARIRSLLVHARDTVPFWRRRLAEVGFEPEGLETLEDLRALPQLTRDDVGGNLRDILSRKYRHRRLYWSRSGGTTARALPFTSLREAMWLKAAAALVLRRRMGWHPGDRVAMLWGDQSDFPKTSDGPLRKIEWHCSLSR